MAGVIANKILGVVGDAAEMITKKGVFGLKNDEAILNNINNIKAASKVIKDTKGERDLVKNRLGEINEAVSKHVAENPGTTRKAAIDSLGFKDEIETQKKAYGELSDTITGARFDQVVDVGKSVGRYFVPEEKNLRNVGRSLVRYGTAAAGVRLVAGGDLMTNSKGERDIAGIPFF